MAKEVRRIAPHYFLQTPNIWFPVEPHFKLPFVHWLPEQMRAAIVQATRRSRKFRDAGEATQYVQRLSLLNATQVQCLLASATRILRGRGRINHDRQHRCRGKERDPNLHIVSDDACALPFYIFSGTVFLRNGIPENRITTSGVVETKKAEKHSRR